MGAEVVGVESGAEIAAVLANHKPHLLLIDIGMAGEPGSDRLHNRV
jgi:DNA-binding NarL/FixJ family response regulator